MAAEYNEVETTWHTPDEHTKGVLSKDSVEDSIRWKTLHIEKLDARDKVRTVRTTDNLKHSGDGDHDFTTDEDIHEGVALVKMVW